MPLYRIRLVLTAVIVSAALTACASDTELQKEGPGSNQMLKSPCACTQIPYQPPHYSWINT